MEDAKGIILFFVLLTLYSIHEEGRKEQRMEGTISMGSLWVRTVWFCSVP